MKSNPSAIVADDEDLPRAELRRMLQAAWPELQLVAECEHGVAAVGAIELHAPQIAFLDVRMPGINGLAVARAPAAAATSFSPPLTATTPWLRLTPARWTICSSRSLPTAWRRACSVCSVLAQAAAPQPDVLIEQLSQRLQQGPGGVPRRRRLSARVGDTIKMFSIDEVLFFQNDEKYTLVVIAADKAHVRKPLKEITEAPDGENLWAGPIGCEPAWAWRFRPM